MTDFMKDLDLGNILKDTKKIREKTIIDRYLNTITKAMDDLRDEELRDILLSDDKKISTLIDCIDRHEAWKEAVSKQFKDTVSVKFKDSGGEE